MSKEELLSHYKWLNAKANELMKKTEQVWREFLDLKNAGADMTARLAVLDRHQAFYEEEDSYFKEARKTWDLYTQACESEREEREKQDRLNIGRPKIGIKRTVSLTLTQDDWDKIDSMVSADNSKVATVLRDLVIKTLEASYG